jgi:hypothetical protein
MRPRVPLAAVVLYPPGQDAGRATALWRPSAARRGGSVRPPAANGNQPSAGDGLTPAARTAPSKPWPLNTGTPLNAGCSASALQKGEVYTEQQIQTAYGATTLRAHASGTPVITILDLGGGWLPSDLKLAGQCFGYSPPKSRPDAGRRRRHRDQEGQR